MAAAHDVEALLMQLGSSAGKLRIASGGEGLPPPRALALSWPELDAVLPDGGLPPGIVELSAPRALGGSTSVALAAVRAGQARGESAWCAWLDPEGTLHAPGVVAAGVELARLLVVRTPRSELARVAVKVVASGAFEVVVIDFDAVPRAEAATGRTAATGRIAATERAATTGRALVTAGGSSGGAAALPPGERRKSASAGAEPRRGGAEAAHKEQKLVRKLALSAEPSGATVLLLTNASRPRAVPWPVALRIELSRPDPRELVVRIAKDRRGRIGLARTIPFRPVLGAAV